MTELRESTPPPLIPAGVESILEPGEAFVWSAQKSTAVMLAPFIWATIFVGVLAIFTAAIAPRTWSIAAYCEIYDGSRCVTAFFIMWPAVVICIGATLALLSKLPSVAAGRDQLFYAVTSNRAIRLELGRPKSLRTVVLNGAKARVSFLGNFRVVRSITDQVTFHGLDEYEIAWATMAATRGGAEKWP